MESPHSNGLRFLFGIAGLLLVLAGAWYVQNRVVAKLRQEQDTAADLLSEGSASNPPPERRWGHVILGKPSGQEPSPRHEPALPSAHEDPDPGLGASPPTQIPQVQATPISPPEWPEDLELVVRPGQFLSKIAAAEYGRATEDLVQRLAAYNGLSDPDKLRTGQTLKVPVRAKLLAATP